MQSKIPSFVIFTREIQDLFLERKITKDEYFVYMHLRLSATPYGITTTSLSNIRLDLLKNSKDNNYANKIMLGLKKQRLLFYRNRVGCRGSFKVHFPNFILPGTKRITNIDSYFVDEKSELSPEDTAVDMPELSQSLELSGQNSKFIRRDIGQMLRGINKIDSVRTCNTDTNIENNKKIIQGQILKDLGNK